MTPLIKFQTTVPASKRASLLMSKSIAAFDHDIVRRLTLFVGQIQRLVIEDTIA